MSQGEWHLLWVIKRIRAWGRSQRESRLPQHLWAEIVIKPYYLLSPVAETVFWHCTWLIPTCIHIARATKLVVFENMKINMQVFAKMCRWQDLRVNAFYGWPIRRCVSLQIRVPDQVGAQSGKRSPVRHGIGLFTLENTHLTIYMIEVKSKVIQSRQTGSNFFP